MDNYVGKVVKITGRDSWGNDFAVVGIVFEQKVLRERPALSLIQTNGSVRKDMFIGSNDKITSTKVEPELRAALKEAFKAKAKLVAFEKKYAAEKEILDASFAETLSAVKDNSNEMTSREFMDEVERLFKEKYPSTGGMWDQKYFTTGSWSSKEVTMCQVQDVEKYANPEKFDFLFREYDNTIHVSYESKSFKDFCARNAPPIIPELQKHCKIDVDGSLGDKEWLSAIRTYTFPLKYGYSKKSLEDIKERIFGIPVKKPSLESQMRAASNTLAAGSKQPRKESLQKDR